MFPSFAFLVRLSSSIQAEFLIPTPFAALYELAVRRLIWNMWITVILICIAIPPIRGAKILGVLMIESKSHYSNLWNVADELASRGYEVCYLTEFV